MASAATTSSSSSCDKAGPGRPRLTLQQSSSVVAVVSKEEAAQCTQNSVFSLSIPNSLLFCWHQNKANPRDCISHLNASIENGVVQIKRESDDLAQKLVCRARLVYSKARKKTGRARQSFLDANSVLPVCSDDVVKVQQLQEQVDELQDYVIELETDLNLALEEVVQTQEAVECMSRQLSQVLVERDAMVNTGRKYEDVGARQKKRKLAHFQSAADAALWFAESFGLVPEQLTVHTVESEEAVAIPLCGASGSVPDAQPVRRVDEFCAMQTLYLLDKFGVSDEFYHELTQVRYFYLHVYVYISVSFFLPIFVHMYM